MVVKKNPIKKNVFLPFKIHTYKAVDRSAEEDDNHAALKLVFITFYPQILSPVQKLTHSLSQGPITCYVVFCVEPEACRDNAVFLFANIFSCAATQYVIMFVFFLFFFFSVCHIRLDQTEVKQTKPNHLPCQNHLSQTRPNLTKFDHTKSI